MQEKIIWFWLQLKALMKGAGIYVSIVCMVGLLILINLIAIPDGKNLKAGICVLQSQKGEQIAQNLKQKDSVFEFISYDSRDELQSDVEAGRIECGFVFDSLFDKKFENGMLKKSIEYLSSPSSTKGAVICETVYTVVLKDYSEVILLEGDEKLYGNDYSDTKEARLELLLKKNREYYGSDSLFSTNFVRVATNVPDAQEKTVNVLRGMAAFMIFLFMYLHLGRRWSGQDGYRKILDRKKRFEYDFVGELAVGVILLVICLVILGFTGEITGIMDVIDGVCMIIYSGIWITVAGSLIKNRTTFYSQLIVISVFFLLLSPVFVDLTEYIPAIRYVRILIPINLFLL